MDADFSVELGADDPTLEFPWEDAGTELRHFDIKKHPEQIRFVDEAEHYRELHAIPLRQIAIVETAKTVGLPAQKRAEAKRRKQAR